MERQAVSSSNLAAVGYDPATKTLEVEFKGSGAVYQYAGVPQDIYDSFIKAESVGRYFQTYIRPCYEYKRL
jgi:KTSC domain